MSEHYYAVIMAGGGGTRLWPLSRQARPKQMLQLFGRRTLFEIAVDRLEGLFPPERIFVVTSAEQAEALQLQSPQLPPENFVLEPEPRGTAAAVGLSAVALQQRDPQAVMAVLTADHFIADEALFRRTLDAAEKVALDGYLVTLGIPPKQAATAYGYVQQGEPLEGDYGLEAYRVLRFKEKPDQAAAEQMLKSGDHTWNSGMFIWPAARILSEFQRQMPALYQALQEIAAAWSQPEQAEVLGRVWPGLRSETIDYGIMEGAENVAVISAAGLGWNDVGSWNSLFEVLPGDAHGNIVNSRDHISIDSRDSLVFVEGGERLVVAVGVEDLIIVDTGDVLLVCAKEKDQDVRQVIAALKAEDKKEYL